MIDRTAERENPEIEMKLEADPRADPAAALIALLGDPREEAQASTYFDTSDHALRASGTSLRIRRTDAGRVQTVKAGAGTTGLFVRSEWERPVTGDAPVLYDALPIGTVLGERVTEIEPVFRIENTRSIWMNRQDGVTIEVALDRGRALADGREAAFCEIELEQKGPGARDALFALARRIDATIPVHPGVLTKSERGYRLLGPVPSAT